MRHGQWSKKTAIERAIDSGNLPASITGKRPVAVETSGGCARFLYEIPDREPLPMTQFSPFRQYHSPEAASC